MASSLNLRTLLVSAGCLCGGVALGVLIPSEADQTSRAGASVGSGGGSQQGAPAPSQARKAGGTGGGAEAEGGANARHDREGLKNLGSPTGSSGASESAGLGKLPPEKIMALFEKVSNLKSESRKYILAYRLASQMEPAQIEQALNSALHDLSDGDYVTTRALARRWVELDPKAAASKAMETKEQHLLLPLLESWSRIDPSGPLSWALQQDPANRAEAVLPLIRGRMLDQSQLEKLVMNAGSSESDDMRRQVFPFATSRLAETNPQGALHAASSVEDPDLRQRTLVSVMSRLGQTAPDVAKNWLATQQTLAPEQRAQLEAALSNPAGKNRRFIQ